MIAAMEPLPVAAPVSESVSALPPDTRYGGLVMKVNHAGEHGAVCIYRAQIAVARWRAPALVEELCHFLSHELGHRALFEAELKRRGRRRCYSYHLCGLGGLLLGFVTGLAGAQAIVATSVAVERVVLAHLQQQMTTLAGDPNAYGAVLRIVQEEQEHHDRAKLAMIQGGFWPRLILPVVSAATNLVIWSGMRLP